MWAALPTPQDIYTENASSVADLLTPHELCAIERLNREGRLTDDLATDVPHAQRALANVATYMIFDDHEITDDWNLTQQWSTASTPRRWVARSSATG